MSDSLQEQIARAQADGVDVIVTDDGIERLPNAEATPEVDLPEPELVEVVGDDLRTRPVPADDPEHPDAARFGEGADTEHGGQRDAISGHEPDPDDDFSGGAARSTALDRDDDPDGHDPDGHDPLDIVTAIKEALGFDVDPDESGIDASPDLALVETEAPSATPEPSGDEPGTLGDCEPDIG